MSNLKKEFKTFMDDVEKNISNPKDLEYIQNRVVDLFDFMLKEMDKVVDYKEEKMNRMEQRQQEIEEKMTKMQQIVDNIEKDIYSDEGFDFEITCPYCNSEFIIDMDEERTEVTCPECNNVIELDWSGDVEEGTSCSSGSCEGCHGCDTEKDEDDDM